MKNALLPSLLFTLTGLWLGDELRYAPEEGSSITYSFLAESESSMVSATLEVDGEVVQEVDEDQLEGVFERESIERIEVTDELQSVEDGRVTEFTRSFIELHQEREESSGENSNATSSQSDLEGISVDFSWDEGAEEYDVSFTDEDSGVDQALLEHLNHDLNFEALLPDDELEEGDEWELEDPEVYLPLMWPSGLLGFYDEGEEGFDEVGREGNLEVIESLEVSCQVTYEGEDEREGERVAVLSVAMQISGGRENEVEPAEGPSFTVTVDFERDIEGEILWNLEGGHLHSASFEGDVRSTLAQAGTVTNPDTEEEFEVVDTKVIEGTITYTLNVERD